MSGHADKPCADGTGQVLMLPMASAVTVREFKRVHRHVRRAFLNGRVHDLTLNEWLQVLTDYGWRCAYCGGPHESMEHVLPIWLGGGTTVGNCVPCCEGCNERMDRIVRSQMLLFGCVMVDA